MMIAVALWVIPSVALAQTTAPRIQSRNGAWLLPVAGHVLCSDEAKHIGRGSVRAWDLCVPYGSAIYPLADGRVIYAGCSNAGGYGCWVMIDYGNGYKSIMGHMISGSITVRNGDTVRQNQQIGRVGWTGMTSFGPHVHTEISQNGNRVMIGDYFDRGLLEVCNLCNLPKSAPVVASGTVGSTNVYLTGKSSLWAVLLLVAYLVLWFLYDHKRVWAQQVHNAFVVVLVGNLPMVLAILIAVSPGSSMGPNVGPMAHGAQWDYVYTFMRRWEGARCVYDPVRTYKGITQGTYNRYRMTMGMGPGDVCRDLTEQQASDLYYRMFYLASGADKLQPAIALQVFDMYVNSGRNFYSRCGDDFYCYTRARTAFYQSSSLCRLYCKAWLNRLADLERYVTKGGS